jgi:hypothetical protein
MKTPIGKLKQVAIVTGIALSGIAGNGVTPANALTFTFNSGEGITPTVLKGYQDAGALWSAVLSDNINVNYNISYQNLGLGTLGAAGTNNPLFSYTAVYNALNDDRASADDYRAVANLPARPSFNVLINRTSDRPSGVGLSEPYVDNNNSANNTSRVALTNANAKALGLAPFETVDGNISLNSNSTFTWDFDRSDGISAGTFDFVGVAAHEIGHTLGFFSGADTLDNAAAGTLKEDDNFILPLDLFRYSKLSAANGAIDVTADTRAKYFSLDKGATAIADIGGDADFSTGVTFGDAYQSGHWKENSLDRRSIIGIMDPATAAGELKQITEIDLRAFDVIGWNRTVAVPEPSSLIGTLMFAGFGAKLVLKRRQKLSKSTAKSF